MHSESRSKIAKRNACVRATLHATTLENARRGPLANLRSGDPAPVGENVNRSDGKFVWIDVFTARSRLV